MEEVEPGVVAGAGASTAMLQRIQLRLPDEMVSMIDHAVETGLGGSRSDVIRKILSAFQNMGSTRNRERLAFFVAHILSEPLELAVWFRQRAALMAEDDEFRLREAGIIAVMTKAGVEASGILEEVDFEEIRQRVFRTISSIEGFGTTPELFRQTPLAEGPSVSGAFEVLISHLTQRIKLGAQAEEVADMLEVMVVLAGLYSYYNVQGVDSALAAMAEACDVQDICLGNEGEMDFDAFESAFEDFYLVVPALCDNLSLREGVKLCLLRDLLCFTGLPVEEAELLLSEKASEEDAEEEEESQC